MSLKNSLLLHGLQVLVVDDDIDSCELLEFVFQGYDMSVQTALTPQDALEVFARFQPDILVLDIGLPEKDGYLLLHEIRDLEPAISGRSIALAMTANMMQSEQQAIAAGFDKLLLKPLNVDELVQVLVNLIYQQEQMLCQCCA